MKRKMVSTSIIVGVLLLASAVSFSCTRGGELTVTSLSIENYGPVIDNEGKWVGDPTGLQGPSGPPGPQGPPGAQVSPGQSMIVAMGMIKGNGTVIQGLNVSEVTWDDHDRQYEVTLTGINYDISKYVTVVAPVGSYTLCGYRSEDNKLVVTLLNLKTGVAGPEYETFIKGEFSFVVYQVP